MPAKSDLAIRPLYVYKEECNAAGRASFSACWRYILNGTAARTPVPMLFQDNDSNNTQAARKIPVEPAQPSDAARHKDCQQSNRCANDLPDHSTLLADLSTVVLNTMQVTDKPECILTIVTELSDTQQKAFDLQKSNRTHMFP